VNKEIKLCLILTEERILIVDAIEKTIVNHFRTEEICGIEGRPLV
jgi:hypothetical protein